ncbi:hypothetical protein DPMN_022266 [Dreissena polymorpha]|uniref:Uncharacterized protein n=1 Tax=Dreissena polymorpha TaxID=45954 RepID=A0A9D4NQ37_DREPO|nr:hypothetical protein DPMN_022266 [Dreissena polymorpha]
MAKLKKRLGKKLKKGQGKELKKKSSYEAEKKASYEAEEKAREGGEKKACDKAEDKASDEANKKIDGTTNDTNESVEHIDEPEKDVDRNTLLEYLTILKQNICKKYYCFVCIIMAHGDEVRIFSNVFYIS